MAPTQRYGCHIAWGPPTNAPRPGPGPGNALVSMDTPTTFTRYTMTCINSARRSEAHLNKKLGTGRNVLRYSFIASCPLVSSAIKWSASDCLLLSSILTAFCCGLTTHLWWVVFSRPLALASTNLPRKCVWEFGSRDYQLVWAYFACMRVGKFERY